MCCILYTFCSYMYCYVHTSCKSGARPKCHICLYDTPKSVFARLPACHFLSLCSVCEDFPGKHELPINTSDASQHQRLDWGKPSWKCKRKFHSVRSFPTFFSFRQFYRDVQRQIVYGPVVCEGNLFMHVLACSPWSVSMWSRVCVQK